MIGKRIADNVDPVNPGEYSKHIFSMFHNTIIMWKVIAPNGVEGFIQDKYLIENHDGTITGKFSICIQNTTPSRWIGWLDKGEWKDNN